MAINIPSLKELAERTRSAFRAELPGSDAWIWPNNLYPTAKVIAAAVFELFLRLRWVIDQAFVTTAEGRYLDRHGADYGIARLAASFAAGTARVTGTAGAAVGAGALLANGAGLRFRVLAGATVPASGTIDVTVRAVEAGAASNTLAGAPLTLVAPAPGLVEAATTPGGIGGGTDEETDDRYRERLLFRLQNPPHGGAPADYVMWAREIAGVTRVWPVRAAFGPGTIAVYFLMDDTYPDGIPLTADVSRVSDHFAGLAPAGAIYSVFAPRPLVVDVRISGLQPDTTDTRDAVTAEIAVTFRREASPSLPGPYGSTARLSVSWLWQAAANASGEHRHRIVSPAADVPLPVGSVAVLGSVIFE
jgi:uncharacterized phage protein gp47/JayE